MWLWAGFCGRIGYMAVSIARIAINNSFENYRTACVRGTVLPELFRMQQDLAAETLAKITQAGTLRCAYAAYKKITSEHPNALSMLCLDACGKVILRRPVPLEIASVPEHEIGWFLDISAIMSLGLSANQNERRLLVEALAEAMDEA